MSTPQWELFLNLLQQREAVPEKLIRHLRKQLRTRQPPPSARSVAAWLVDHGHLTRFQAQELLKGIAAGEEPGKKSSSPAGGPASASPLPEPTPASGGTKAPFPASPPPAAPGGPALLDDLEALDTAGAAALGPAAADPGTAPPAWGVARIKRSVWESPLFLLGGGGLILLVVIAVGLYWAIGRESADQLLQSAEEDYNNGAYTQAIEKFERFLDYFPDHTQAGHVRVLRGLAIMRRAVDQSSDWEKTLQIIEETVKQIRKEEEFPEARPELAALLPRVAEGLTDMAESRQSAELLEKARRVYRMILNPNYVPDKLRNRTRLTTLEGRFLQIERMLGRNRRLDQALQQIRQAIQQRQTRQAYEIRRQLLKEYPELETNPQLQQAIAQATGAERRAIRYQQVEEPAAGPAPKLQADSLPVAHTRGKTVPEAKNHLLFVTAAGALWAVSAEDGKVRWRQYLGKDLWLSAVVLPGQELPDVVVWSPQHRQLWRLQGKDGTLRWHVPLPKEPAADPVLVRDRLYVPVEDQLWEIQVDAGRVLGRYEFPQSLSAPPIVSESLMFLPAGHSNIYVLDLEKRTCVGAFYLGHEQNTIVSPGIVAGPFVILAENTGQKSSRLRVLRFQPKKHTLQLVQSVRLQGQVFRPLVLQGRVLAVATDLGQVVLFEVNPQPQGKKKEPLSPVASRAAVFEEPGPVQVLLEGARVWVADHQLTRYRIQAAQGQMNPDRVLLENVSFPLPLQKQGEALFVVAQEADGTVRVAAYSATSGQQIWLTRFAMPMSWTPLRESRDPAGSLSVVDPQGNVYQPRWPSGTAAPVLSPVWSPEKSGPAPAGLPRVWLPLESGLWAGRMPSGARWLPVLRHGQSPPWQLLWHELPEALLVPPVPWQGKLLLASSSGPLFVLDAVSGRMVGLPYFPPTVPGRPPSWLEIGATQGKSLLLAAEDGRLLRFDKLPGQGEALTPGRQIQVSGPLRGPVILFERAAWLWDAQSRLVRVSLPELKLTVPEVQEKQAKETPTFQGPIWGPAFCGPDRVLLLDRDGKLLCLSQEKLLWEQDLSGQLPVGEPLRLDQRTGLLAIASGKVLQLDLETGAVRHARRTSEALAGSPLLLDDGRVLVPTPGGAFQLLESQKAEKAEVPGQRPSRR